MIDMLENNKWLVLEIIIQNMLNHITFFKNIKFMYNISQISIKYYNIVKYNFDLLSYNIVVDDGCDDYIEKLNVTKLFPFHIYKSFYNNVDKFDEFFDDLYDNIYYTMTPTMNKLRLKYPDFSKIIPCLIYYITGEKCNLDMNDINMEGYDECYMKAIFESIDTNEREKLDIFCKISCSMRYLENLFNNGIIFVYSGSRWCFKCAHSSEYHGLIGLESSDIFNYIPIEIYKDLDKSIVLDVIVRNLDHVKYIRLMSKIYQTSYYFYDLLKPSFDKFNIDILDYTLLYHPNEELQFRVDKFFPIHFYRFFNTRSDEEIIKFFENLDLLFDNYQWHLNEILSYKTRNHDVLFIQIIEYVMGHHYDNLAHEFDESQVIEILKSFPGLIEDFNKLCAIYQTTIEYRELLDDIKSIPTYFMNGFAYEICCGHDHKHHGLIDIYSTDIFKVIYNIFI